MQTEAMAESEGLPYPLGSARDILTALFRQKYIILGVFLVIFAGVIAWVNSEETLYEAQASVILKMGREHIVRPEVGTTQYSTFNDDNVVESEISIVTSQDLAKRVVAAIGVHKIYPEYWSSPPKNPERAVDAAGSILVGKLTAKQAGQSNVINISFLHQKPKMAATVVNTLIEFLKEKHLQIFSDPKASFLTKQLQDYQEQLEQIRRKSSGL